MAKDDKDTSTTSPESVISIIGKGMTLTGNCETEGAIRIEGTVHGDVRAGKAVVIGKEGIVDGNIYTQDAVISGRVLGSVRAQSRLELQAASHISGEIEARRMQLDEGASVQGQVSVGEAPAAGKAEAAAGTSGRDGTGVGPPEGGGDRRETPGGSPREEVRTSATSIAPATAATSPGWPHTTQRPAPAAERPPVETSQPGQQHGQQAGQQAAQSDQRAPEEGPGPASRPMPEYPPTTRPT